MGTAQSDEQPATVQLDLRDRQLKTCRLIGLSPALATAGAELASRYCRTGPLNAELGSHGKHHFAAAQAQIPQPAHPRLRAVGEERLATLVGGGFRLTLGHDHSLSPYLPLRNRERLGHARGYILESAYIRANRTTGI